jgi:hypothetical protein
MTLRQEKHIIVRRRLLRRKQRLLVVMSRILRPGKLTTQKRKSIAFYLWILNLNPYSQIAAKKAKAAEKVKAAEHDVETRQPHHTEAQIAAKKAKADAHDKEIEAREPHHTEA